MASLMQTTRTPVFEFEPEKYRAEWTERGIVHIEDALSSEFRDYLFKTVSEQVNTSRGELSDWKFAGKKNQFLFEFSEQFDFPRGLYQNIARMTGLPLERLTLCERHVKVYDRNADPSPVPHKDRLASEVVVGFPVVVPDDSCLILYPSASTAENPFQSTAEWRELVSPPDKTAQELQNIEPVRVYARLGDVMFFKGSRTYHERVNGGGSALLFLKFNAMRMDPLGEDHSTGRFEKRTENTIEKLSDDELLEQRIEVTPRLQKVTSYYNRRNWKPVYLAARWGERDVLIDREDVQVLRALDAGGVSVQALADTLKIAPRTELCPRIRRLCNLKFLILANEFPYQEGY